MRALLFFSLSILLIGCASSQKKEEATPPQLTGHVQEDIYTLYGQADLLWENFEKDLQQFLDITLAKDDPFKEDVEVERESILEMQREFLIFREKMTQVFSSQFPMAPYGAFLKALHTLEITKWYIHFLEEHLYPLGWRNQKNEI